MRSTLESTFCFLYDPTDAWQAETDPVQRQFNAKPLDCGLASRSKSFAFVHDLEAGTRSLLGSMHREVDAKSNNLGSGFGSFAFLHNVGDSQWTELDTIERQVQNPLLGPIPPSVFCGCCICVMENGKYNFHCKFVKVQRKVKKDNISKHAWKNIALKFWRCASEFNSQLFI